VEWKLAIVALAVLGVAGVSRRLSGTSITTAMAFVVIGVLAGPLVADEVNLAPTSATVRTVAEATLAVVLFADASRVKLGTLRHEFAVPLRLLGIGLPLTIIIGAVLAAGIFSQLSLAEAFVLAVVLAPTDAALGQSVVTEPRLPSRIRQGLNVESGLNDGICVPLLLIALAAADVEAGATASQHAVTIVVKQIGYGLLGGAGAGLLAALIVEAGSRRQLIADSWLQVIPVAAATLAYAVASALHGSGFIAAFIAGAVFGRLVPRESDEASRLGEELGGVLGGVTFLIFGAILLGPALQQLSWQVVAYAILSLTLVRMLPVAIALLRTRLRADTVLLMGWFGPRGLASVVFTLLAFLAFNESGRQVDTLVAVAGWTILLSVLLHGLSAEPLARWYAQRLSAAAGEPVELVDLPELRPRHAVLSGKASRHGATVDMLVARD